MLEVSMYGYGVDMCFACPTKHAEETHLAGSILLYKIS